MKYSEEEEKKAIEYYKKELYEFEYTKDLDMASENYFGQFEEKINMIKIILNLIEKQRKEIERLKKENKNIKENSNDIYVLYLKAKGRLREFVSEDELNRMECIGKYTSKNYIPKEAVIDKIQEVKEEFDRVNTPDNSDWYIDSEKYAFAEEKLKELLGE